MSVPGSAYKKPAYTQMPNKLFDEQLSLMNKAELKITLAICRKTFGWHKDWDQLSLSQLEKLTGLSRQGVINGIEAGLERGTLERLREGNSYIYHVVVMDDEGSQRSRPPSDSNGQRSRPIASQRSRHTKETPKENSKETATPSEPTPVTFQQWGDLLRETRDEHGNIVAVLVKMHNTLYPDRDPPAYGRMGNLAKRVGGVMRVAQLLWETSTRPPAGRVCDFIEATAKGRFKGEHDPDKPFKMG